MELIIKNRWDKSIIKDFYQEYSEDWQLKFINNIQWSSVTPKFITVINEYSEIDDTKILPSDEVVEVIDNSALVKRYLYTPAGSIIDFSQRTDDQQNNDYMYITIYPDHYTQGGWIFTGNEVTLELDDTETHTKSDVRRVEELVEQQDLILEIVD